MGRMFPAGLMRRARNSLYHQGRLSPSNTADQAPDEQREWIQPRRFGLAATIAVASESHGSVERHHFCPTRAPPPGVLPAQSENEASGARRSPARCCEPPVCPRNRSCANTLHVKLSAFGRQIENRFFGPAVLPGNRVHFIYNSSRPDVDLAAKIGHDVEQWLSGFSAM